MLDISVRVIADRRIEIMGAFLSISVWFSFVTVVPGLITLATLFGAFVVVDPKVFDAYRVAVDKYSSWQIGTVAIGIMILTQAAGIVVEKFLVRRKAFGNEPKIFEVQKGIDALGHTKIKVAPREEYEGLYFLLAGLKKEEDTQGHLQRIVAQFFLTNNTLVSFLVGIMATSILVGFNPTSEAMLRGGAYVIFLGACLWLSYQVAKGRFWSMAKAICIIRRGRLANKD